MAGPYIPIGELASFGTYTFAAKRSALIEAPITVQSSYASVIGTAYGADRLGRSVAPFSAPEWHWEYWILCEDHGATADTAAAAVETEINALFTLFRSTNGDGSSGQSQVLTVNSAIGGLVQAQARLLAMPIRERSYSYVKIELVFRLESDFQG